MKIKPVNRKKDLVTESAMPKTGAPFESKKIIIQSYSLKSTRSTLLCLIPAVSYSKLLCRLFFFGRKCNYVFFLLGRSIVVYIYIPTPNALLGI